MFARFKFNFDKDNNSKDWVLFETLRYYQRYGNDLYSEHKKHVKKSLDAYLSVDGMLDAEQIEGDWFPQIPAHIFFSHSHLDEALVIYFAGFLYKHYGIVSFIDSAVWGYADELLREIDNKYCWQPNYTYNYDLRNQSTAHVHMLLQGALAKMIDRAECIIFVNTPHSLNVKDIPGQEKTSSPWIYNELLMAGTFPPSPASRYSIPWRARVRDSLNEQAQIPISYTTNLKEFRNLKFIDFKNAEQNAKSRNSRDVLNQLYLDKGLI